MEQITLKNYIETKELQEISESFVNIFPQRDSETADKYKKEVWDMLQKAYANIGGIRGSGFASMDDMKKIPMWKLVRKDGVIVAAALYKDKMGRKRVASCTNFTDEGKKAIRAIYENDFTRASFEISEASLGFHVKILGYDFIRKWAIKPDKVVRILNEDEIEYPVPKDNAEVKKHPQLADLFYLREIGGHMHAKIYLGTVGKPIV